MGHRPQIGFFKAMEEGSLSARLQACTRDSFAKFEVLRRHEHGVCFWDVIVLTATDAAQAVSYETQLAAKVTPVP